MVDNNVGVIVRVRPLLEREPKLDSLVQVMAAKKQDKGECDTVVLNGKEVEADWREKRALAPKQFDVDKAVWSFDNSHETYMDNMNFYVDTGPRLLRHYFDGFNVCLLAYGQTGSGKTHTMMGDAGDMGLIPLLVRDILSYKEQSIDQKVQCQVKFSYVEIYNEKIRDLLYDGGDKEHWKVREHPETGPYVEGVQEYVIESVEDFNRHLDKGNTNRATASTSMNQASSRSHAIINLQLKQTKFSDSDKGKLPIGSAASEVVSNIKLVDLAGSERLSRTGVFGQRDRIKEGTLINKSLAVLGRCINGLSTNSANGTTDRIPYRDSMLTFLLRENLGGNSKTVMIFCVAPLDYDETLQTLNYATRVKQIKTKAKVNKTKFNDVKTNWVPGVKPEESVVDTLKQEISQLTEKLQGILIDSSSTNASTMVDYLEKQLDRANFQNTYLQNKLNQQEQQMSELKNHIQYLQTVTLQQSQSHEKTMIQVNQKHTLDSLDSIQTQLMSHSHELDQFIQEHHPSKVF